MSRPHWTRPRRQPSSQGCRYKPCPDIGPAVVRSRRRQTHPGFSSCRPRLCAPPLMQQARKSKTLVAHGGRQQCPVHVSGPEWRRNTRLTQTRDGALGAAQHPPDPLAIHWVSEAGGGANSMPCSMALARGHCDNIFQRSQQPNCCDEVGARDTSSLESFISQ
ncbi:hypothetical protein VTK26DRAFT_8263 [Humicola hyalothermophila]